MDKKIANIVFYKFWDPTREEAMQQACVFYADGTVKNVLYEEGKELANEVVKEAKIKTKAEFTSMINTTRIYALSGAEFEKRFKEFLGTGATASKATSLTPAVVTQTGGLPAIVKPSASRKPKPVSATPNPTGSCVQTPKVTPSTIIPPVGITPTPTSTTPKPVVVTPTSTTKKPVAVTPTPTSTTPKPVTVTPTPTSTTPKPVTVTPTPTSTAKPSKKKKGLFSKLWVKVTAFVLAATIALTGAFHLGKHCTGNQNANSNQSQTQTTIPPQDQAFLSLLSRTTNVDQKSAMQYQSDKLDLFNRDFADNYLETGKNIKASLTWDEMMALNLAYNTYSKDQIRIMFNGVEADATALSNAYRNANLQLMGAYVISDRQHPVNSSSFLTNDAEKAFVDKYSDLFYKMKETTGDEQVAAIKAFYTEIYKDFPITEEAKTEGISHADDVALVAKHKAAITPMVMAAEIMFQNTSGVDRTLSDKAIEYFNELGLCNLIDEEFERVETITLTSTTDENQPLYTEFRDAKITELMYEGNYPISDERRDLSQLAEFQKWVNGHFEIVNGVNTGVIVPNTTTSTTTKTETTVTVTGNREEAVSKGGAEAVKKAEEQVDEELAKQNAAAQQQAQAEADKNSEAAKNEVANDQADMQNKVDNANDKINNGGTVNEGDFGDHNVDFDAEHEDGNGNLNDSVKDITTDGTGAKTENDLPDPNQTGAIFDGTATGTSSKTATDDEYIDNEGLIEYEEPYYGGTSMTNEEIVNAYIASLEGQGADESAKVYTK